MQELFLDGLHDQECAVEVRRQLCTMPQSQHCIPTALLEPALRAASACAALRSTSRFSFSRCSSL
jgi:hypothetical protein